MSKISMEKRHFSEEQISGFRTIFNSIDSDRNGLLNKNEFITFLRSCEIDPKFVDATFKVFDENGDGCLSFDEYILYLDACARTEKEPRYLFKLVFDAVDEDHNGGLSLDEVKSFVDLCGVEISMSELNEEHKKIDSDNNSYISFDELCMALRI